MWKRALRTVCLVLGLSACADDAVAPAIPSGAGAQPKAGSDAPARDAGSPSPVADTGPNTTDAKAPNTSADAGILPDAASADAAANTDAAPHDAGQTDAGDAAPAQDAGSAGSKSLRCMPGQSYGDPLPTSHTATLVKGSFGFLEGPVWISSLGVLLFSDMDFGTSNNPNGPNSQLRRFKPPNTFDVLVAMSGSNGTALDNEGRVLAVTHDTQSLSRFDPMTGAREKLTLRYQDKHFNSPNDLCVRSDGNVYFSDPDWQLGPRTSETGIRGLYRMAPDGNVTLITSALNEPNGVALSPDELTLYVGSQDQSLLAYTLDSTGKPGASKTFATTGSSSDGMTMDCAGNLYVSSTTVQVFSSSGTKLGDINVAQKPSNLAFGGTNQTTLFITAESGLYSIELKVPGRAY